MNFILMFLMLSKVWAARDLDSVLIDAHGAQALPQICPIMVVARIESVDDQKSTNGEPPVLKIKVLESIWGHLKKNNKVKAQWLPLENLTESDSEYESWSKNALKLPEGVKEKDVVLGFFPSESKKDHEFVIKPLCRYWSSDETKQRLTCLRDKRCHEFLPGRLVIR